MGASYLITESTYRSARQLLINRQCRRLGGMVERTRGRLAKVE